MCLFIIVAKTMIRWVCLFCCCVEFAFNNTFLFVCIFVGLFLYWLYCFDRFVCGCVVCLFLRLFTFRLVVYFCLFLFV